jgi:hypothetical protein
VRDVERVLQLSPAVTRSLIRAGFVNPERGPRREFRFSFQDLIVLRTARALLDRFRFVPEADLLVGQLSDAVGFCRPSRVK